MKANHILEILTLLPLLLFSACSGLAGTYYVSLQGRDENDGQTEATAFRTVKKGVSVLQAGDTLIIKSGDYGDEQAEVQASGTEGAPITIRAEEPGKVILRGTGGGAGLSMTNKSHIVVEGIEFTNYDTGIGISRASTHVTVRRCIFRNNHGRGIILYGNSHSPTDSHHHLFTENQFLDYVVPGQPKLAESHVTPSGHLHDTQDYGLQLYFSTHVMATHNYFYGLHNQALSFKKLMFDSVAAHNVFEGFQFSALYIGQNDDSDEEGYLRCARIIAEGNVFRPTLGYRAKRAICVANVSDAIVRNNFIDSIYGDHCALQIAANSTGTKVYGNLIINVREPAMEVATGECEIFNNTIAGCDEALNLYAGANPVLRNNIFYRNKMQVKLTPAPDYQEGTEHKTRRFPDGRVWTWRADPAKKPVFEHNNWFPDWEGKGASDISVEPRFVGPFAELRLGEISPKFVPDFERAQAYRLAKDSPCIDKGVKVGLPFVGAAPDLGAFEFGAKQERRRSNRK